MSGVGDHARELHADALTWAVPDDLTGEGAVLYQHDVIEATFQPRRTEDLKPSALAFIGQRRHWYVAWRIDEEDGGNYVGEFACSFHEDPPEPHPNFVWVPSGDLADVELVSGGFVRAEAEHGSADA